GDFTVAEPMTLWGTVGGNVTVAEGGKLYLRGAIYGDITIEYGGRCHIFGRIVGSLTVKRGAKVIHSGVLGGDATNEGGRLYIENTAVINGKIKTLKGETKISKVLGSGPTTSE
ncbi:MAG: polymer-forming cytoskeletal protein, partial [Tepidisphaeraceae bacterium]